PVVAPGEVVETADEVCKFPGQRLSWWQAQESCEQRFGHLVLRHPDAVLAPRLPDPIWVGKREAPLQRPPQRLPSEECPTWDPGPRTEGFLFCLQPVPFLCCYRTAISVLFFPEQHMADGAPLQRMLPGAQSGIHSYAETYQQLQDAQSWSGQDVISQVNALANAIVLLPDPLSEAHGELSLAEASNFLGILERLPAGLAKETAPLGPAALLAGMHFLKKVAALGMWEPEPMTGPWEQLGQAVVSVASLVLEEQLAGLELRSLHLRETSTEGQVFTMPGGHPEGPGHILIPAAEVRRLLRKGLSGVTMIHSWFSSSAFQYTLGAPGREPQAPDTSEETSRMHRFLSTQVGSAIISSEVWDETGEANTAVTFHLQHWAQVLRDASEKQPP
ncbi:Adhesion G-protein coupled receptor D2, partial [Eschrichtius robustus]|nr:Adhesion G-protein coupled receptor D2 [Eschrichtius robustus]